MKNSGDRLPHISDEDLDEILKNASTPMKHWWEEQTPSPPPASLEIVPLEPAEAAPKTPTVWPRMDAVLGGRMVVEPWLMQWRLWESQFVETPAIVADDSKPQPTELIGGKDFRPYVDESGFTMAPNWFLKQVMPTMSQRALKTMMVFYRLANRNGKVIVTLERLAEETEIDRRHLAPVMKLLVQSTLIQRTKKGHRGTASEYLLTPVEKINLPFLLKFAKMWSTGG